MSDSKERERASIGAPWMGMATLNPMHAHGEPIQGDEGWQGWVFAIDADTGAWAWRAKIRYPEACGMTPTDGGFTFFGNVGSSFCALDSTTGEQLWSTAAPAAG